MTTETTNTVLDRSGNRSARPVAPAELLYLPQLDEVMGRLQVALNLASKYRERRRQAPLWSPDRVHNNLGILGSRGAGKTSFLLTLLRLLGEEPGFAPMLSAQQATVEELQRTIHDMSERLRACEDGAAEDRPRLTEKARRKDYARRLAGLRSTRPEPSNEVLHERTAEITKRWSGIAGEIVVGGLVEPSLMEPGDHIVVSVFATLLENARNLLRHRPPADPEHGEMAENLMRSAQQVIDHLPAVLVRNRLQRTYHRNRLEGMYEEIVKFRSGINLELALCSFVENFLRLHGQERRLVVMALDDVDLAYDRGEEVLETLRRYLTTPRMLFLVTGDLQLFNEILKKSNEERLRRESAARSPEADPRMVDDIVEHYLKKLLPPHLRVHLPETRSLDLTTIHLGSPEAPTRTSSTPPPQAGSSSVGPETGNPFTQHFAQAITSLLITAPPDADSPLERELVERYRFLVPQNVRHFIELSDLPLPEDSLSREAAVRGGALDKLLFHFAQLWESVLARYGVLPAQVVDWVYEDRVGLHLLNHLLSHPELRHTTPELHCRDDNPQRNVVLAFMRFAVNGALHRQPLPELLRMGLDFCVPARLLSRLAHGDAREALSRELHLQRLDSQRRLYRRMVPHLLGERAVRHGVVRLTSQPAALEKLLDIHDDSPPAAWRKVLRNPRRRGFPRARRQASDDCLEFLRQGPTESEKLGTTISSVDWATAYLPLLLKTPMVDKAVFGIPGSDRTGRPRKPLVSEMVTTPRLFGQLAGVLPNLVLRCWMPREGRTHHPSVWHGLSLVSRVVHLVGDAFEHRTWSLATPKNTKGRTDHVEGLEQWADALKPRIREALRWHLEPGGNAPDTDSAWGTTSVQPGGELTTADVHGLLEDPRWKAISEAISQVRDPRALYPDLKRGDFRWPRPCVRSPLETVSPGQHHVPPWEGELLPIKNWNDLQSFRSQAWDRALDNISTVILDWALAWCGWLDLAYSRESTNPNETNPEIPKRRSPPFHQVRMALDAFIQGLDHDPAFAGIWTGMGDILQHWVLAFLNAVLVETLQPPAGDPKESRPYLVRGGHERLPGRGTDRDSDEGCNHALYQNLARLEPAPQTAGGWRPSLAFHLLASFPLLAVFLPRGGPLPRRCLKCRREDARSNQDYCSSDSSSPCSRPLPLVPPPEDEDSLDNHLQICEKCTRSGNGGTPAASLPDRFHERLYGLLKDLARDPASSPNDTSPDPAEVSPGPAWISYFGSELFRPLPSLEPCRRAYWAWGKCPSKKIREGNTKRPERRTWDDNTRPPYPLDLTGLSWCGLDLVQPKPLHPDPGESRNLETLTHVDDRRDALIAMLNALVVDVEPTSEVQPYLADLAIAVHDALEKMQAE